MHKNAQKLANDPRRLVAARLAGMHKNAQACTTEKSPRQAPVKKLKGLFVFSRPGGAQECTTMHN
jgi:hypothetical protein